MPKHSFYHGQVDAKQMHSVAFPQDVLNVMQLSGGPGMPLPEQEGSVAQSMQQSSLHSVGHTLMQKCLSAK